MCGIVGIIGGKPVSRVQSKYCSKCRCIMMIVVDGYFCEHCTIFIKDKHE